MTYKINKSNTRPYVCFYVDIIDTITFSKYLVVKNYGKSVAIIDDVKFDFPKKFYDQKDIDPFIDLKDTVIAPSQKLMCLMETKYSEKGTAAVKYHDINGKNYSEIFNLNFSLSNSVFYTKENEDNSSIKNVLKNCFHALIKHMN